VTSTPRYSVASAEEFSWGSVTGDLQPERIGHLSKYLRGNTVLDAGCGGGGFVDFLCRQGLEVTGVDAYEEMIVNGREMKRRGHYVQADLTALPFAAHTFDSTYCFDVLEHIDDVVAIRELARVTRHRLILAVPKKDDVMSRFNLTFATYRDPTHLRYYTEASLEELLCSIPHRGYSILPEAAIPLSELVAWAIEKDDTTEQPEASARVWRSKIEMFLHRVVRRLLRERTSWRRVPSGLVGVVDLQ